jgi:pimeloyl-ACP methyl ester carboxylesterase
MNLARAVRLTKPRLIIAIIAAALAAAMVLVFSSQAASARPNGPPALHGNGGTKRVIVLVHGAWADASSWDGVIQRLQNDGYTVYAPPNPLRGLPQDSAYLHDFLTQNAALAGKPVILVGHSYGGAVITNAAVGDPEVKALVYVDAFIPDQGETLGGLLASVPGSCLAGNPTDIFNLVPYPGGPPGDVDTYIKPNLVPGCFASGLPASQAALIAATQRPLAASTLSEPSGIPAWKTIPS